MTVTTTNLPYGMRMRTANKLTLPNIEKLFGWVISRNTSIDEEVPTQYLLNSLKESEEDYKSGRYKSFETAQEAHNYLDEIINSKKNK